MTNASTIAKKAFTPHGPVGREVNSNIITKKADAKLNHLTDIMTVALGAHCGEPLRHFLDKTLPLEGLRYLDSLHMRYRMENRLFAIIYDLLLETSIPARMGLRPENFVMLEAKLKGKMFVSDAVFTGASFSDRDEERVGNILGLLNNDLIRERIVALDLNDISVSFDPVAAAWTIRCRSMIGSTTWNLIPPITQFIKPKEEECIRLIEFFELVAASCSG
jgi:hypothetical protein